MPSKTIANRYRQARLRVPYTVPELARRSGVSKRTIYRIESGEWARSPYMGTIRALADALGVEVADLLAEEDAA